MPKNKDRVFRELPTSGKARWNQLAPFMPISRETFRRLAIEGKAPRGVRFSLRTTLFDLAEINKWLNDPINYKCEPVQKDDSINTKFNLNWAEKGGVVKVSAWGKTFYCKLIEIDAGSILFIPIYATDTHLWVDEETLTHYTGEIFVLGMATQEECRENEVKFIKRSN